MYGIKPGKAIHFTFHLHDDASHASGVSPVVGVEGAEGAEVNYQCLGALTGYIKNYRRMKSLAICQRNHKRIREIVIKLII